MSWVCSSPLPTRKKAIAAMVRAERDVTRTCSVLSLLFVLFSVAVCANEQAALRTGGSRKLAPPVTSAEGSQALSLSLQQLAAFLELSSGAGATAENKAAASIPFLESGRFVGRGRGRGRAKVTYGPEEFDSSWWLAPPSVGPDSFLRGYDQRVYPHGTFGYGGMPNGGFGSGSMFWGGPTYHNAMNVPWFHDMGFNAHPKNVNAMYSPYLDLADTFGRKHGGGLFPLSSPYISFPPPLQGDWNLPHSPNMVVAPP